VSARTRHIDIYDAQATKRLLRRARRNPERYYDQLYDAFWNDSYRLAYGILGNAQDAEDVAQSALTRALAKLDTLEDPQAALKWIHRIVGNAALNYGRDENRRMAGFTHTDADISEIETATEAISFAQINESNFSETSHSHYLPEELMMRKEVNRIVLDLVNKLSSKQRQAIMLYYYAGLSTKEIATDLDITETSVTSLLFRARETLNERIQEIERTQKIRLYGTTALPMAEVFREAISVGVTVPASLAEGASAASGLQKSALIKEGLFVSTKQWLALGATAIVLVVAGAGTYFTATDFTTEDMKPVSELTASEETTRTAQPKPSADEAISDTSDVAGGDDSSPVTPTSATDNNDESYEEHEFFIDYYDLPPPIVEPEPPLDHLRLPDVGSLIRFGVSDGISITWAVTAQTSTAVTITALNDLPSTEGIFTSAEQAVILSTTGGIRPTIQLDGYRLNFVFKGGFCYAEPI